MNNNSKSSVKTEEGVARLKPQFLFSTKATSPDNGSNDSGDRGDELKSSLPEQSEQLEGPEIKKLKISEEQSTRDVQENNGENEKLVEKEKSNKDNSSKNRNRGQNKNRPRPHKFCNEDKLCSHYVDGQPNSECPRLPECHFLHDINKYLGSKKEAIDGDCFLYLTFGKCPRGLTCLFASSHIDSNNHNIVNEKLWSEMQPLFEQSHRNLLDKDSQIALRKHKFDFKSVEKIYSSLHYTIPKSKAEENSDLSLPISAGEEKTLGSVTDEDVIRLRPCEVTKIDWQDKLYLSPLTTVGNLPFRRLCVEMGADITCSEMSLATSVLQGNMHEFALHRRHPSEKLWGVQLCANNGILAAKAAHALAECGIDYDFVDLNMGCPLDPIYRQGAGSGLMCRTNKFHSMVKGMTAVLAAKNKPFTVKMRTGIKTDKNIAHSLIQFCKESGVSAVTLHGRSREQRYLRNADWNYIGQCAKIAHPMAIFGNGDILSWEDYVQKKTSSNVTGVMIGRGALIKPWIFQEIKEQRNIDLSSSERLELVKKYVNYGLDHWGSDSQGVSHTRKFLLEFLSFFHRYIPYGILEDPPQLMNQKPPKYFGRDDMETLLASSNSNDWVKISEMFLGPVPDHFIFVPKHKANSWSNG